MLLLLRTGFDSKHPCGGSESPVTSVLGNPIPSFGSPKVPGNYTVHTHVQPKHFYMYNNKINKSLSFYRNLSGQGIEQL